MKWCDRLFFVFKDTSGSLIQCQGVQKFINIGQCRTDGNSVHTAFSAGDFRRRILEGAQIVKALFQIGNVQICQVRCDMTAQNDRCFQYGTKIIDHHGKIIKIFGPAFLVFLIAHGFLGEEILQFHSPGEKCFC